MNLSLPVSLAQSRSWWRAFWRKVAAILPKGLYARALLIVIVPMVILQCVLTFVFMERHWQLVTKRLSTALTQDIAAIVELHKSYPGRTNDEVLAQIAQQRLKMDVEFLPERRTAAGAAETILLDPRCRLVERNPAPDRQTLLARYGRALAFHRDQGQAR